MKTESDLFRSEDASIEAPTTIVAVEHNGRSYRLRYTGNMARSQIKRFCEWSNSPAGVSFMHDAHHEIVTGLERRRVHTKKPAQISGYAIGQWVRFIYGHPYFNTWGPLLAKLLAAVHPEHGKLFKERT